MRTGKLETERLLLREISAADVNDIWNCWMRDEEVSRYMWWKACDDIAAAEEFVNFELDQVDSEDWYRWIITLKETEKIIGTCLVFVNRDKAVPHWDISYNLGRAYWGKGYTTEAMKAVMAFASGRLGMNECITSYAKANKVSENVLRKLGFKDISEISYECGGGDIITDGIICCYHEKADGLSKEDNKNGREL